MRPKYPTFGENLFWAYSNWQMIYAATKVGKETIDRQCYIIRQGCFKRFKEGKQHITDLFKMNNVKVKSGDICFYCHKTIDKKNLTIDHVFPQAKGGESSMDNTIYVCKNCNSSKGKRDLIEWFLLYRDELPSPFVLGHYYRQIYAYAMQHDIMDADFEGVCSMQLPFNPKTLFLLNHTNVIQHYLNVAKENGGNDWDNT